MEAAVYPSAEFAQQNSILKPRSGLRPLRGRVKCRIQARSLRFAQTPEAIAASGNCPDSLPGGWLKPLCGLSLEFCALRKTPEAIAACGNCSYSFPGGSYSFPGGWLKPHSG
jgi:hypothetical protein